MDPEIILEGVMNKISAKDFRAEAVKKQKKDELNAYRKMFSALPLSAKLEALDRDAPREEFEQEALAEYLDERGIPFFSTQNGAKVSRSVANRAKKEGMKSGVPDIIFVRTTDMHNPCALEMKRQKGGVLSHEQKSMIEVMRSEGWHVIVAKGARDAIKQLEEVGIC